MLVPDVALPEVAAVGAVLVAVVVLAAVAVLAAGAVVVAAAPVVVLTAAAGADVVDAAVAAWVNACSRLAKTLMPCSLPSPEGSALAPPPLPPPPPCRCDPLAAPRNAARLG